MPDYLKNNKDYFSSFTQERWEKWIWERTHGIDTITNISVVRDPNPHHAIIDSYRTLTNKKQRNKFGDALMSSLRQSLEECQNYPIGEDDNLQLEIELLALERHLHILNRLDDEDIPSGAVRTSRAYYQFVLPLNQCNSLRRIALAVRSRVGDRISDSDLRNALNAEDTYVVAFRCALKKYSSLAISKFFPQFVEMALRKQKEVFIKVELIQLVESFGQYAGNLRRQLSKALPHLSEEARAIVRKQACEIGFHIPCIKPVEDAIRDRGLLIYADNSYVEGSNYNYLAKEVTNYLSEEIGVSAQPSVQGIIWHLAIVDMNENVIDFLYDPYFVSDARSLGIDIVQFGWINTFKCLLHAESAVYERIQRIIENEKYDFKEQITRSLNAYGSMQVGVLGDTAAASAVRKALHERSEIVGIIIPRSSVEELSVWLSKDTQNRIVICDHGIAKQMTNLTAEEIQARGIDVTAEEFTKSWRGVIIPTKVEFSFDEPIRVGFAYPVFDDEWGEVIKKAVRHVILENLVTWEKAKSELKDVGIITFSLEELCKSLGITELELQLQLEKSQREVEAKVIEQQEMLKKAQDGIKEAEKSGAFEEMTRLREEVAELTDRIRKLEEEQATTRLVVVALPAKRVYYPPT